MLAVLPLVARAQAVPVEGAVLRLAGDAPTLEVGEGVYLPKPLALTSAAELEACRAARATGQPANAPSPAAGPVVVGFAAGLVVGVALAVAGAIAVASALR